jgi:hypothetical protein
MQRNQTGERVDLGLFKKLKDEMPEADYWAEFSPDKWHPVMEMPNGDIVPPTGKSLGEMNEAMKAAGWSRAERRRYLAKAKRDGAK